MSSLLELYKGPENKLNELGLQDGRMMFATDTKTIYLDCDFTDGNGTEVHGRFPFGGGAAGKGIIFADRHFDETVNVYHFEVKHIEVQPDETAKLPNIDNVIFNVDDGYFYRVINKYESYVEAERLNTVGTGGGAGGGSATGITALKITPTTIDLPHDVKTIPIVFGARSRQENAELNAILYINDELVTTFKNIKQSNDFETNLFEFDVYKYKDRLLKEDTNTVSIYLEDNWGYTYKVPLTWNVTLYEVTLKFLYNDLGTQYGPFSYDVVPSFDAKLINPTIEYEIIFTSQNSQTYKGIIELADATTASISVPVPAEALRVAGAYRINLVLSATIKDGETITSKTLSSDFVYQVQGSEQATIISDFPGEGTYDLYDAVKVRYRLSYNREAQVKKSIIIQNDNDITVLDNFAIDKLTPNIWVDWNITFTQEGYYTFKLELLDSNGSTLQTLQSTNTYLVKNQGLSIPALETSNLIINLVPNKLNTAVDRDKWVSKTVAGGTIECKLSGFNWNSNGWENEAYTDAAGNKKTISCLHLNNGAKVEIDYNPWATSTVNGNYGAEARGLTVEFDVKIKNIQKKYERLISCVSERKAKQEGETDALYTGIVANGESFTLNSRAKQPILELEDPSKRFTDKTKSGLVAYYTEGERVHVTYVINPREVASEVAGIIPTRVAFTYLNGVISGIVNYSETDKFLHNFSQQDEAPKFIFDSAGADIYIYNFRVYNTYLDSATVLKNYYATYGDYTAAAEKWKQNDLLKSNNEISLKRVAEVGTIPYLVIRGGQQCSEVENSDGSISWAIQESGEVGLPYKSKSDYRIIDAYFVDPKDSSKNIGSKSNRASMVMYPQGTSSLIYPVKNLRIQFANGESYSLMDDLPPVDLFTLKADYMESSGSHNTGAANALNSLYESINLKTPAQELNPNYVTAIKGRPIVVFFKSVSAADLADANYKETDDDYQFIGKYNFNLDKATPEPFGFFSDLNSGYGVVKDAQGRVKSGFIAASGNKQDPNRQYYTKPILDPQYIWNGQPNWKTYIETVGPLYEYHTAAEGIGSIQCWELKTNTSDLVRFQTPWNEMLYQAAPEGVSTDSETYKAWEQYEKDRKANVDAWKDAFESRYPKYKKEPCADKRGIIRLLNWVASTNQMTATNELLTNGCDDSPIDNQTKQQTHYGYNTDSAAYRLAKFIAEAETYLRLDFMSFYYVMTEVNYMIDSRAKNMMLCSFDQDMDAGTGHWFPIFYDMDTQLGIDNEGKIRFLYDDEDYEFGKFNTLANYKNLITNEDNGGVVNILWANFSMGFQNRIRDMYLNLRTGALNVNNLLRLYNDGQADAWSEVFCNEDAEYKYLRPFLSGEMTEEMEKEDGSNANSANRLYAAQGTRTLHRTKFIKSRLNYLDSKYQYNGSSRWEMRAFSPANPPEGWNREDLTKFNLYAKDTVYVNYGIEADDIQYSGLRIEEGTVGTLQIPMAGTATEQSMYLYSAQAYSDLGDLSTKYLSNISYDDKSNEREGSELTVLQLSPKDKSREYYKEPGDTILSELNVLSATPLIEEFWLQNTRYSADVNLAKCYYLKNIYCAGSPITDITLPDGGVLERVELPSTVEQISIKGHRNLIDLQILLFRDHDNTQDKSKTNTEDWSRVTSFTVSGCDKLDTKNIFKKLSNSTLGISLPDIDWVIDPEKDDCVMETRYLLDDNNEPIYNEDGSQKTYRIITSIPVLDKLVATHGISESEMDITALNRTYVAGNVHIANKHFSDVGIDEVLLYTKYQQYYPLLTFSFDHDAVNIKGFSFNIYSSTSDLLAEYSRKFRDNELQSDFTLEKTFGSNTILIPPQNLNLLPRYNTEFVGWNLESRQEFYEDLGTYNPNASIEDNIAAARAAAEAVVAIKYDAQAQTYQANGDFDFKTAFTKTNTLNFYPTFVATVQSYEVTFYDGLNSNNEGYGDPLEVNVNGVIQTSQMVRHSEQPIMPMIIPQKMELPTQKSVVNVYLFKAYNNLYTYETKPTIVGTSKFKASYNVTPTDIRQCPSSEGYFEEVVDSGSSVKIRIKQGCSEPALTIPKSYRGKTISGLMSSHNSVKRIFFEKDNQITIIDKNFKINDTELEYVDFNALSCLDSIEEFAFQGCINLEVTMLPNSLTSIGQAAFSGCTSVAIMALPENLQAIGINGFSYCSGIRDLDFNQAQELKTIGQNAFYNCENLSIASGRLTYVEQLSSYVFTYCSSLGFTITPDSALTHIGSNTFEGSSTTINALPDNLKIISSFGFGGLLNKDAYIGIIPPSVEQIDSYAFSGLTFKTDELIMENSNIKLNDFAFDGAYIPKIRIPANADLSSPVWAQGLINSWGATTRVGGPKTPLVWPDGSEVG